jgi:hypothetical protein
VELSESEWKRGDPYFSALLIPLQSG